MEEEKLDLILKKIKDLEEKVEDSNDILRSNRSSERWGKFFNLIKWVAIVAMGIVSWSYIQPMYQSAMETYDKVMETNAELQETFKGVNEQKDKLEKITDKIKLPDFLK